MVALPPALVHGGGAGGAGTGSGGAAGAGTGVATGPGTSGGAGGTGIDPGDPDFSEYFRLIERRVRAAWRFPEGLGGTTQTVKIGFALAPEGSLRDARVVSSSSATLNESALSAMKRAAPFPPLPHKFRALAGQPLVMSFTIIIR
jgi:TonB family protein